MRATLIRSERPFYLHPHSPLHLRLSSGYVRTAAAGPSMAAALAHAPPPGVVGERERRTRSSCGRRSPQRRDTHGSPFSPPHSSVVLSFLSPLSLQHHACPHPQAAAVRQHCRRPHQGPQDHPHEGWPQGRQGRKLHCGAARPVRPCCGQRARGCWWRRRKAKRGGRRKGEEGRGRRRG